MSKYAWTPKFQTVDADGNPLVGGLLYTYIAGTSTPIDTYTDYTGDSENENPIELDARGEANIWLTFGQYYKFVLKDENEVTLWTVDQFGFPTLDPDTTQALRQELGFAMSGETTPLTDTKTYSWTAPRAGQLYGAMIAVGDTASSSGDIRMDMKKWSGVTPGNSVLTTKPVCQVNEYSSLTGTVGVINPAEAVFAAGQRFHISVDEDQAGTDAVGVKFYVTVLWT